MYVMHNTTDVFYRYDSSTVSSPQLEDPFDAENEEYLSETGSIESDLAELYESFDFEASVSQASTADPPISDHALPVVADQIPLYPDAQLTSFQSHLLLFQYAVRHSLTTKALLQLLSVHLPQGARVPKSVYHLKRFFLEAYPEANAVRHYFCACCQRPLPSGDSTCDCGGGSTAMFITVPLGPQIKRKMEGIQYIPAWSTSKLLYCS